MKWVEMIRGRSSSGALAAALHPISAQAREITRVPDVVDAMVLTHALFDGDLAVVLLWDNERHPVKTREGLMIAENLEQYGLVDHAVWVVAPGFGCHVEGQANATEGDRGCR